MVYLICSFSYALIHRKLKFDIHICIYPWEISFSKRIHSSTTENLIDDKSLTIESMNNATCKPVVNNYLSKFKIYNVNHTNKYRLFDADKLSLFFALPTSMHIFIDSKVR